MFGRILAFLAVLSFALVTGMTAAHATRMAFADSAPDHGGHQMAASDAADCGAALPCGSKDVASCAAICAGVPVSIIAEAAEPLTQQLTARPQPPAEQLLHGQSPGLNERPPQSRLL